MQGVVKISIHSKTIWKYKLCAPPTISVSSSKSYDKVSWTLSSNKSVSMKIIAEL